jgi:uncharacterized membrane protein
MRSCFSYACITSWLHIQSKNFGPFVLLLFSLAPYEDFWPPRFKKKPYEFVSFFQDGLRRRMDKLKSSIEEGNQAVDRERQKNVSLLHLIFPPDIAKRLWLG